jgi:hypothetical protein
MTSDDAIRSQDRPFRMGTPTLPTPILYLCGTSVDQHKGPRLGGYWRAGLPMLCPLCAKLKGKT